MYEDYLLLALVVLYCLSTAFLVYIIGVLKRYAPLVEPLLQKAGGLLGGGAKIPSMGQIFAMMAMKALGDIDLGKFMPGGKK